MGKADSQAAMRTLKGERHAQAQAAELGAVDTVLADCTRALNVQTTEEILTSKCLLATADKRK